MKLHDLKKVLAAGALVAIAAGSALAQTPNINSAVVLQRVFNDCPSTALVVTNLYPSGIHISEGGLDCGGFANLHIWKLSENGSTGADFPNNSCFQFAATVEIKGTTGAEAGIQISPWYSDTDGRFNVRSTDGEVAVFGGRLPFYSFTGSHGVVYVEGTEIRLQLTYDPNSLSPADPATIVYEVFYNNVVYSSGPLAFDEGNPTEDPPYGLWGILNFANVGGYVQSFLNSSIPGASTEVAWKDISFEDTCGPVSVDDTSWGQIKGSYR